MAADEPWPDGQFKFQVRRGEEVQDYALDLLVMKLTTEELEVNHGIVPDQRGDLRPTVPFLRDLAVAFDGLGVTGCTPTIAYELWASTHGIMRSLKKRGDSTPDSPSGST